MTFRSSSYVATENASRYLRQLCKHWGHHFRGAYDPNDLREGSIDFGNGQSVQLRATETELSITVQNQRAAGLEELENLLVDHIQRFGFKESLQFIWRRDGEASEQEAQ